jgi:hypothetical protein
MTKCSHTRMRNWHREQCKSPATVNRDGKDYCRNHDPLKAEVAKSKKNVTTMYAVTRDRAFGEDEKPLLNVTRVLVVPHGAKELKVLSAVEMNPKAYRYNEEQTRPMALGCKTVISRDLVSPSLKEAFLKLAEGSIKQVEDARVKADDEQLRHDAEQVLAQEMMVLLEVP